MSLTDCISFVHWPLWFFLCLPMLHFETCPSYLLCNQTSLFFFLLKVNEERMIQPSWFLSTVVFTLYSWYYFIKELCAIFFFPSDLTLTKHPVNCEIYLFKHHCFNFPVSLLPLRRRWEILSFHYQIHTFDICVNFQLTQKVTTIGEIIHFGLEIYLVLINFLSLTLTLRLHWEIPCALLAI